MRIKSLAISNFRSYYEEVKINFLDLTAIVGKNDIGKSTILEALDVFFNNGKGIIKLDEDAKNEKEKDFEAWLTTKGCKQNKQWIRIKGGVPQQAQQCTIETYIRNFIHHPENNQNLQYSPSELKDSIDEMKRIAASYLSAAPTNS